jgi:single-stranded-DNA-specific exonuclease
LSLTSPIWLDPLPIEIPEEISQSIDGHPVLLEALVRRGIHTAEAAQAFLDPGSYSPASPQALPDLERAVERIEKAIQNDEIIGVWGDFDADGQTSTALLTDALQRLGARTTFYIPLRATESHGIKLPGLSKFLDQGVNLLLTCDTGVSEYESVQYAAERNVDTIITDHHTLPEELPEAYAVINSQRMPEGHPLHPLCGVGVAYKLIEALFQRSGLPGAAEAYLDLVALGTIADVAPLIGDNRYMVQKGIALIRQETRLALTTLLEIANVDPRNLTEETLGFVLAPRLNAMGRLSDANSMISFLNTSDLGKARVMATQLEALNSRRKLLSDQVFQAANSQVLNDSSLLEDPILVLSHPAWPGGIVGIVANRLAVRYNRPVLLLTTPPGEIGRGSARSIQGINITQAFDNSKHLLKSFGGHAMAAGVAIEIGNIPKLRRSLSKFISALPVVEIHPVSTRIDAHLPLSEATLELADELDQLAPFGAGNPQITFAAHNLSLKSNSVLGKNNEGLQLIVEDEAGNPYKVIWWRGSDYSLPEGKFDLAYTFRANSYRAEKRLQLLWQSARQQELIDIITPPPTLQIIDCRHIIEPQTEMTQICAKGDTILWAEGEIEPGFIAVDRNHLEPASQLIIWSIPPGPAEIRSVIQHVNPQVIYLFALRCANDQYEEFLRQLGGMIKYAQSRKRGWTSLSTLAAALGHRETTIMLGIQWLLHNGNIQQVDKNDTRIQLIPGGEKNIQQLRIVDTALKEALCETKAFRSFLSQVDARWILGGIDGD